MQVKRVTCLLLDDFKYFWLKKISGFLKKFSLCSPHFCWYQIFQPVRWKGDCFLHLSQHLREMSTLITCKIHNTRSSHPETQSACSTIYPVHCSPDLRPAGVRSKFVPPL